MTVEASINCSRLPVTEASKGRDATTVDLVIPVYNERAQIESTLTTLALRAEAWPDIKLTLTIADNGSTDGTTEIATRLASTMRNVRHCHLNNKGRGRALRQAWSASDATIVAYMDVDLSTDISLFPSLIAPIARRAADISVGSRLLRPELTVRGMKRELISRSYNRLLKHVFSPRFSDAQCGFKALSKRAADELIPLVADNEWFFDTELLLLADHFKYRIYDLPVRWRDDPDSRVRLIPTIIQDLKGVVRVKRTLGTMHRQPNRDSRATELNRAVQ